MRMKPRIEMQANEFAGTPRVNVPRINPLVVTPPPQVTAVPVPPTQPLTIWGAKRQAKYFDALTGVATAQSGYYRALTEVSKSFVAAARAANEVAELPEICASDTEIRRTQRETEFLKARTELEQARYGLLATQDEVDKLRKPRMQKALPNNTLAIEALLKTKVDMEALGEDTSELEQTIAALQRV